MIGTRRPHIPTPHGVKVWKPGRGRLLLPGLVAATCLHGTSVSAVAVAVVPIATAFRTTAAQANLVVVAGFVGAAGGAVLAGRLADRFGCRRLLLAGMVLVIVTATATACAPTLIVVVLARGALGAATASAYPAAVGLLVRHNARAGHPPQLGCAAIVLVSEIGFGIGPVLGGTAVAVGGWPAACLLVVPAAVVAVVLLLVATTPVVDDAPSPADVPALRGEVEPGPPLRLGQVVAVLVRTVCQFVGVYLVIDGMPLWLQQHGMGAAGAGATVVPLAAVSAATVVLAARRPGRQLGPRRLLFAAAAALVVAALGLAVTAATGHVLLVLAVCGVIGLVSGATLANTSVLLRAVPHARSGTAAGLSRASQFVGGQLAAVLVAAVGASTAPALLTLAVVVALVAGVLAAATSVVPQGASS